MIRNAVSKVMWVGRATVFCVGLAVILALTVGLTSAALAGTGVGARFDLGKTNAVNQVSKLIGTVAGPSLTIDNNSANGPATALNLQVEAGKAPMKVNSDQKVANLNSDRLDGKDSTQFFSGETYLVDDLIGGPGGGGVETLVVACDEGDKVLGGGGGGFGAGFSTDNLLFSVPTLDLNGWFVGVEDVGNPTTLQVRAVCADFPPLRP